MFRRMADSCMLLTAEFHGTEVEFQGKRDTAAAGMVLLGAAGGRQVGEVSEDAALAAAPGMRV